MIFGVTKVFKVKMIFCKHVELMYRCFLLVHYNKSCHFLSFSHNVNVGNNKDIDSLLYSSRKSGRFVIKNLNVVLVENF